MTHNPDQAKTSNIAIGEFIAVRCKKYNDKPLIGRVTAVNSGKQSVTIDWLIGSYSGMWREWRGRSEGKSIVYSDDIPVGDILLRKIDFTKSRRLRPTTVASLKELY